VDVLGQQVHRRPARKTGVAASVVATVAYLALLVEAAVWRGHPPGRLDGVSAKLSIVVSVLALAAIVWIGARGGFDARNRSSGLSWAERRRALAQIRGRSPVVDEDLPVTQHYAGVLVRRWSATPFYAVLELGGVIALMHVSGLQLSIIFVVAGTLALVGLVLIIRDAERADRFLRKGLGP
jgi:hypothetical protein